MKKASKILYLVGAILSILGAVSLLFWGVASLVLGSIGASYDPADIVNYINANYPEMAGTITVEAITAFMASAIAYGVTCIIFACFCVAGAVFAFKARKEEVPSRLVAIFNIVFGALGCGLPSVVAGIFSLIVRGQEEKKAE